MGMACPALPTATGDIDTDLAAKVTATLEELATHDFVMLHVGGPDEATHRGNVREKADFVAKLDRELIAPILAGCADGTRIMLTCDHMAFCRTGGHSADPVAFLL
jgi:2,3-bisphosphoglycerate-independent phosphoglycerate mutase